MDIFYLLTAGVLILLVAGFAVFLLSAIVFNMNVGRRYRASMATQLETLRLSKMLTALGIDINEYLHTQRTVDIKTHMQRCSQCANTDVCDDNLAANTIDTGNINYCNNEASLKNIVLDEMVTHRASH